MNTNLENAAIINAPFGISFPNPHMKCSEMHFITSATCNSGVSLILCVQIMQIFFMCVECPPGYSGLSENKSVCVKSQDEF